ncbi:hypothetical protein BJY04DRAFT_217122 [Aspergillus karnatakaensis]|uniref:uncharacterized protein n=1 Tax=Aspergillus karnatakaensis TaxID=1810916 RepID=UPI003CCD3718
MEPSLLDYSRFHGIASDYAAVDPITYIDDTVPTNLDLEADLQFRQTEFNNCLFSAHTTLEQALHSEKLRVSKKSARYLTSVVSELQMKHIDIDWHAILPAFHHIKDARLESPVFRIDFESDVTLSKNPLRFTALDVDLRDSAEPDNLLDVPCPLPNFHSGKSSLLEKVKIEKLRCSRGAFSLITSIDSEARPPQGAMANDLRCLLDYSAQNKSPSPALLPLDAESFPPSSPTPVSSGRMLPSPASSDPMQLGLYSRKSTVQGHRQGQSELEPLKRALDVCAAAQVTRDIHPVPTECKNSPDDQCLATSVPRAGCDKQRISLVGLTLWKAKPAPEADSRQLQDRKKRITDAFLPDRMSCDDYATSGIKSSKDINATTEQHPEAGHGPKGQFGSGLGPRVSVSKEIILPTCTFSSAIPRQETLLKSETARQNYSQSIACQEPTVWQPQGSTGVEHAVLPTRPLRVHLGSLSSFMETRGKSTKSQLPAKSPYFAHKDAEFPKQRKSDNVTVAAVLQGKPCISTRNPLQPALSLATQVPRVPLKHEGLVLVVSTTLLSTNLRVIQCLEGFDYPPKLIYRDYPTAPPPTQSKQKHQPPKLAQLLPPPVEADIIVSPKTGIILTTSQATMQLYLPGHKSGSINTNAIPTTKAINSPLREQIYKLSSRYDSLYILITHGPDTSTNKPQSRAPITVDKHLLSSLSALTAFCTSLADPKPGSGTLIPLLLPLNPERITTWILSLAHKHVCQLPTPRSQSCFQSAFTPINPKPRIAFEIGDMEEGSWEAFLRRLGLNPFAAHVVLAVLRREGEGEEGIGCLSRFVEMSSSERRVLFNGVLGEKILKRVDALIERDWQDDRALNFDGA